MEFEGKASGDGLRASGCIAPFGRCLAPCGRCLRVLAFGWSCTSRCPEVLLTSFSCPEAIRKKVFS